MNRWETRKRKEENTVDILPINDLVSHQTDEDCICGPTNEFVEGNDSSGFICIHHSLDGRV